MPVCDIITIVLTSVLKQGFFLFVGLFFIFKVYNEQIRDLLVNSGPLAVREDAQKGVVVQGLTLHQVCL